MRVWFTCTAGGCENQFEEELNERSVNTLPRRDWGGGDSSPFVFVDVPARYCASHDHPVPMESHLEKPPGFQ